MSEKVWMDKNRRTYTLEQLEDSHLKNILGFICKGGGYVNFIDEERITKIFQEAVNRGIKHPYNLSKALQAFRTKETMHYANLMAAEENMWMDRDGW